MHVSLSALEKALRLVDDLAETDDPADFGERALPGLDRLIRCDSLTYNEIGPAPSQVVTCSCPADLVTPATPAADRDLIGVLRAPLTTTRSRADGRHRARQALTASAGSQRGDLTGRERQILELVALGRTNRSIAHTLEVSPRTVARHLEHIFRKLDVSSRAAAVYRAPTPATH